MYMFLNLHVFAVGAFKKELSVRSCINVTDAVVRTVNEKNKYDPRYQEKLKIVYCF